MERAYGSDWPERVAMDRGPLAACRRLDVRLCTGICSWQGWFVALTARLPNLAHLELREFPERQWMLLCTSVSQLATLRIERNQHDDHEWLRRRGYPDPDFPLHILTNLPRLRSLALPYATVHDWNLLVARDCLERFEAKAVTRQFVVAEDERTRPQGAPVMARLTHFSASLVHHAAAAILERMPHVRSGEITFRAGQWGYVKIRELVARLERVCACADERGDSDGDDEVADIGDGAKNLGSNSDRDRDAERDRRDAAAVRVAWRCTAGDLPADPETIANSVHALAKLGVAWAAHDFDASVPPAARRHICAHLPLSTGA
jgi:hypothetical protein